MLIVFVCSLWAAYALLGGGQIFLAITMVLSILLVGGAFALVQKRTSGEPLKR